MKALLAVLLMTGAGSPLTVPRSAIEQAVTRFLRDRCASPTAESTVEFRSVPEALTVHGTAYDLRVTDAPGSSRSGNVSLPVEVLADGRVDQRCIVSVRVRTFDTVLVSARQMSRHESFREGDVRRDRTETTSLRGSMLRDARQLDGMRTARLLPAGTVLRAELIERLPVVRQGSAVTLVVRGKGVKFSMEALVMQDGREGDLVTVQRAGGAGRLRATVVDQSTVEIHMHEQ